MRLIAERRMKQGMVGRPLLFEKYDNERNCITKSIKLSLSDSTCSRSRVEKQELLSEQILRNLISLYCHVSQFERFLVVNGLHMSTISLFHPSSLIVRILLGVFSVEIFRQISNIQTIGMTQVQRQGFRIVHNQNRLIHHLLIHHSGFCTIENQIKLVKFG